MFFILMSLMTTFLTSNEQDNGPTDVQSEGLMSYHQSVTTTSAALSTICHQYEGRAFKVQDV
ncbi:hypothetical protein KXD40_006038 [Peronospora effusa]|uniref:Uncharacterized protein n=1 Tax=Peronospora effusa TaxID=542832 RepID=A0A3M6V930_9STRA|nr:hypothetical protein DD238_007393 [Peronospora effusa]RMX65356.1 hypothetical protein DD238_004638 [Peronospora effusa]RQM15422.1 hypothetical protein DD237_004068 [Peronospora effusa]RQM15431.1 hypothetical protein DD237_004071 [Peronospora effusa]UIZ25597.1 hypothetical protein KXD40_006038 [Peronospora effusa]